MNDCKIKRLRLFCKAVFHCSNLASSKKIHFLDRLEARLANITGNGDADAKALRMIIRATAALLTPPPHVQPSQISSGTMSVESCRRLQMSALIQRRTHKIFVCAVTLWRARWADDSQIGAALSHVRRMIERLETRRGNMSKLCASMPWAKIKGVVGTGESSELVGLNNSIESGIASEGTSPEIKGCRSRHTAKWNGIYTPNPRLQALKHVKHCEVPKLLRCTKCSYEITSSWYLVAGSTQKVIRPQTVRTQCEGSFLPVDGSKSIPANDNLLNLCGHYKRQVDCAQCGGRDTCEHGKVKRFCSFCHKPGYVRRQGRPAICQNL